VIAAGAHALPATTDLVIRLNATIGQLLDRARAEGAVRADLTQNDLVRLMCGVVFAATVHARADERAALTRRYLDITLAGVRRPR
jgi:hypothetical protein